MRSPQAPKVAAPSAAAVEAASSGITTEDLERRYSYVRKDLVRIVTLGVVVFILIFATTFLHLG